MSNEPISIEEMIREAEQEAFRIEDTQAALVAAGLRPGPAPSQLRRASVFHAIAAGLASTRARQQQQRFSR